VLTARLTVREAVRDDYDAVAEVTVAAFRTIGRLGDYEPVLRDVAGRAATCIVLVAITGGTIVGTATYVPGPGPYAETDDPDDACLRMLAVLPEASGRGIGTALTRRCLALARAAEKRRLVLHTRPTMAAAQRIYERLGFRREPELDEEYPGITLLGYARELRPPP
jgi:ribosomal protein S18 acetylase RimI-like enzyme